MKKKILASLLALTTAFTLAACGDSAQSPSQVTVVTAEPIQPATEASKVVVDETPSSEATPSESVAESEAAPVIDTTNMYRSELTNEWISIDLKDQRPIAVMVDNEKTALPHFGVNDCDVVYELMNSTENDRVTRLMCIMKDWKSIEQLGSIRSVRPTNFMIAAEYNAILCHDGGPGCYINEYVAKKYTNNLSGGFARFSNGKATEFTEYITYNSYFNPTKNQSYSGLGDRIKKAGYSTTYTSLYEGNHFAFAENERDLSTVSSSKAASKVELPFPHNQTWLFYNESKKTYDYYEYGSSHDDAKTGETTTFKNVVLISCPFKPCEENGVPDQHGYIVYNIVNSGDGYYLTNGNAIPITWKKSSESGIMVFTDSTTGKQLELNTGKTYIAVVPSDVWSDVAIR